MQRYNKKYTEHYARLALMSYYDPKYEALEVTESPDLQSEPLGVGIEVTQAISNMEGRCNHYDAENNGPMNGKDESKYVYGDELYRDVDEGEEKGESFLSYESARSFFLKEQIVRERIYDKLVKLNKNYTLFPENALYLFTDSKHFAANDMSNIIVYARQMQPGFAVGYDRYFIDCITRLYVLHIRSEQMVSIAIPTSQIRPLRDRALALSTEQS